MKSDHFFSDELAVAARELADVLERYQAQIVFAESCTAGLVSASLATVPGISRWLCGSAVTYQEATKHRWLDVRRQDLEKFTAVSEQVASRMAWGVLAITPHADWAVSVTGHLGPDAPPNLDAVVFVATANRQRGSERIELGQPKRFVLTASDRQSRQVEAAILVLRESKTQVNSQF